MQNRKKAPHQIRCGACGCMGTVPAARNRQPYTAKVITAATMKSMTKNNGLL